MRRVKLPPQCAITQLNEPRATKFAALLPPPSIRSAADQHLLRLPDPFAQDFPENFETSIEASALCTRFNPRGVFAGHFLAVGRSDGVVSVLDFETKGIVRWFEGHVKAVTTVCWSRNSRYLLTASRDWNAIIWDLSSEALTSPEGERRDTVRFDAPVTSASLHPRNSKLLVVTLHAQIQPVFVDLRSGIGGRWELEATKDDDEDEEDDDEPTKKTTEISTICRFNPRGDLIYVGTSKGNINVWDVQTKAFLWSENTGANSIIKHMEFDQKGSALVINSNDRCIRVIRLLSPENVSASSPGEEDEDAPVRPPQVPIFETQHRFQDLVNRTPWNGCGFSRDGEYIIGGAGHKGSHNIYIWDRESGGLLKILEGPKDPLEDLDWHPIRPLIASVSSLGLIHIWVTGITENWSAYAPGFEELDENMEYEEKEDEFDIEDESVINRRKMDEQDRRVDITSIHHPRSVNSLARTSLIDDESYEEFITIEPDSDSKESFYPPPELEEYYEPEPEVAPQILNGAGAVGGIQQGGGQHTPIPHDDSGNVSEELYAPSFVVEEARPRKKKGKRG